MKTMEIKEFTMLKLKNVSKTLDKRLILNNISLDMAPGKIYGFNGKNGSGKTMLFRAIAGLVHISSGEIDVFGKKLGKDISFPESLGLTIENVGFWPQFTGWECLEILRKIKKVVPQTAVGEALSRIGLDPADKRTYKQYSLGMKQKLAIAQAIMEKPRLLILDEPSNSLDEKTVARLAAILLEEKQRGALILLASHDYDYLSGLCDTIIGVERGEIRIGKAV
jgi:ABC-2 type transport system ATP-binding protein